MSDCPTVRAIRQLYFIEKPSDVMVLVFIALFEQVSIEDGIMSSPFPLDNFKFFNWVCSSIDVSHLFFKEIQWL